MRVGRPGDIAVLAHAGRQRDRAASFLQRGLHVVAMADDVDDVLALRRHGREVEMDLRANGQSFVIGAAMSPGLSGLLARHQASGFRRVDEISVAVHGTAGPACAHRYHSSLSGRSEVLLNGEFVSEMAGSGRQLCWFPEPIGGKDCYLARSVEPELLHGAFPSATRISHRRAARRRDRLTARLPMLSPPPAEGAVGGLWVELRGEDHVGARLATVTGVAELIATASAAVAVAFALHIDAGELVSGVTVAGDDALPTTSLLEQISALGVRLQRFTGVPTVTEPRR